jgi:ribosomal protein S18 acetylase RimI-like enzyme
MGHGRKIMNFAMKTLKEAGDERTMLRVHVDNSRAIHLYESLGFEKHKSYRALIWRR